jgi:lipoprotein signal peptidase
MTNRSYRWLFWLCAVIGVSLDQASKYSVFACLYNEASLEGSIEVIPGAFDIVAKYTAERETGQSSLARLRTLSAEHLPYVNKGALWGTTLQLAPGAANLVFGLVSILAAAGIIYWSTRLSTSRHAYLCFALGLILGGTLGNLYDRIVFSGVRDFLYWHKFVDWPVFNIADCCLVVGAGLLLLEAFFATTESATSSAFHPDTASTFRAGEPASQAPVVSNANPAGAALTAALSPTAGERAG